MTHWNHLLKRRAIAGVIPLHYKYVFKTENVYKNFYFIPKAKREEKSLALFL